MKKIINILLLFVFATAFFACEKEIIKPFNEEGKHIDCLGSSDNNEDFTRGSDDDSKVIEDDNVTDPDEEEDFEEDESVTDPDEEEDFEEEEPSK
jgi:hypothetical protein